MKELGNQGCDDYASKYVLEANALTGSRTYEGGKSRHACECNIGTTG
jgi:hypothetical protein